MAQPPNKPVEFGSGAFTAWDEFVNSPVKRLSILLSLAAGLRALRDWRSDAGRL
jgi:hypothetical protein